MSAVKATHCASYFVVVVTQLNEVAVLYYTGHFLMAQHDRAVRVRQGISRQERHLFCLR